LRIYKKIFQINLAALLIFLSGCTHVPDLFQSNGVVVDKSEQEISYLLNKNIIFNDSELTEKAQVILSNIINNTDNLKYQIKINSYNEDYINLGKKIKFYFWSNGVKNSDVTILTLKNTVITQPINLNPDIFVVKVLLKQDD
jgi:hypothetical protein